MIRPRFSRGLVSFSKSLKKGYVFCGFCNLFFELSLLALLLLDGFRFCMGNEVLVFKLLYALGLIGFSLLYLPFKSLDLTLYIDGVTYKDKGFEATSMAREGL